MSWQRTRGDPGLAEAGSRIAVLSGEGKNGIGSTAVDKSRKRKGHPGRDFLRWKNHRDAGENCPKPPMVMLRQSTCGQDESDRVDRYGRWPCQDVVFRSVPVNII